MKNAGDDDDLLARQLARAALDGDIESVRALLARGADPEIDSTSAAAVLRHAEDENSPQAQMRTGLLETLVLHQQHGRLNAAMYLAAFNGFQDVVDYFLTKTEADALTLNVALFAAARAGHTTLAASLVKAGADIHFKKDLPLRAAIDSGHEAAVRELLHLGAHRAEGLVHAAARGDVVMTALLVRRDDNLDAPVVSICKSLSDGHMLPAKVTRDDLENTLDMLLALAQERGDNMQDLLLMMAQNALEQRSFPVLEKVISHHLFSGIDIVLKREVFEQIPAFVQSIERKSTAERIERFCGYLIEAGGAQAVLVLAAGRGDLPWVQRAIEAGADPRRNRGLALKTAEGAAIRKKPTAFAVRQEIQHTLYSLTEADRKNAQEVYKENSPVAPNGRLTTQALMSVIDAGALPDFLASVKQRQEALYAEIFFSPDAHGYSAIDRISDQQQQELLFDQRLWNKRPQEYFKLWEGLPQDWQTEHAQRHEVLLNALRVGADLSALQKTAQEHSVRMVRCRTKKPPMHR